MKNLEKREGSNKYECGKSCVFTEGTSRYGAGKAVSKTSGRQCGRYHEPILSLNSEIHLISSPDRPIMAGPALTVKARPGDNLMLHKALDMAQEGDVIVVSNDGDRTHSLMGEIMAVYAQNKRKVSCIVLVGPIRDL